MERLAGSKLVWLFIIVLTIHALFGGTPIIKVLMSILLIFLLVALFFFAAVGKLSGMN